VAKDTLFHILLRQPWWITVLVAFAIFWIAHAIHPMIAPFVALPFAVLAIYIGFVQWRRGGPLDEAATLATLRAMPWEEFSTVVADAYRRQGYRISAASGRGYDFKLEKDGRVTLLQCRRWKVNQVGPGPVRELARAVEQHEASRGICLAAGEFSAPARRAAASEPVTLVSGSELVALIGKLKKKKKGPGSI
jgi:restriction system protein